MIKRSGVEVMNARTKDVSVAHQVIDICKAKVYTSASGQVVDIAESMDNCLSGTVLYDELPDQNNNQYLNFKPTIEVTNETTSSAGKRLSNQNPVALNFAAARNQGGGFLGGAKAQEEDLCRASGLYPCLQSKPMFYNRNILQEDHYYTNDVIYSPQVPFFKSEDGLLMDQTFPLSIISAPAPNLRSIEEPDNKKLQQLFLFRISKILSIAEFHGHKTIILGAWGCGAYGNDPTLVADAFKDALGLFPFFDHICFAVYDTRTPPHLYEEFAAKFNP